MSLVPMDQLWAVHAQGPDEIHAAFSREDAEQHAVALNALPMPAGIQVSAVVIASPWSAAEHWKYLAEQEREHAAKLKAFAARPAQAEPAPAQNDLLDGITWQADPYEANVYRMLRGNNWVAHIRMNGEMLIERHAAMLDAMLAAQPAQPAPAQDEQEIIGVERYRVEPTGRGFWPFCVRAGNGERELFIGHRKTCEQVAAELATAYEDGKFVATRPAQTEQQPIEIPVGAIENGRAFAERLEMYGFECEGGNILNCSDWQEFRQCFNHLAEWAFTLDVNAAPIAQTAEAEGVEVVGWRIGFPNGSGYKLYEQRQDWAYEGYGSISYEVQDLMTVAQHERIVAALSARPAQRERIDPFSVAEAIRKALDRNSCPNVFLVIAYEAAIAALSQQAEPAQYSDVVSNGGMDPRNEPAPAQDERKTFEVEIPDISAIYDGRSFIPYRSLEAGERLMTVAQHLRIEKQLRAALTRPAQTERQALVAWATRLYNTGYHAGHNDTVEGGYTHVYQQDMDSYHEEVALEWLTDNPQPAPSARQSQTEQQPTVKDCLTVQPMAYAVFADNGNVACFSTQREHPSIVAFEADGHSVVALAPIAQTEQGDDQ